MQCKSCTLGQNALITHYGGLSKPRSSMNFTLCILSLLRNAEYDPNLKHTSLQLKFTLFVNYFEK